MLYLKRFRFPDGEAEASFFFALRRTCFDTYYPFQVFPAKELTSLEFEPITILCGGNGCGKSTALNVMAEALHLQRDTLYNRSSFFEGYTRLCDWELRGELPPDSRIVTSDDVFDFMLNLRSLNQGIDRQREELYEEYKTLRGREGRDFQLRSMEDYEQLRQINMARSKTQSKYVRAKLANNPREHSNGESALMYFQNKIKEGGLYLLDEPENSLSPEKQRELLQFLEESVRFFDCQLVIATHSPFLLSLRGAKIYHLDETPVRVRRWTELPNVRAYWNFFREHQREFS